MDTRSTNYVVRLGDRPVYSFFRQFAVACFVGTLASDVAYWRTELFTWETFSVWMVVIGCVMAGLAGVVGLFYFASDRTVRSWHLAWPHALVSLLAALLSVVNAFVHSRDGYTAVVPEGLILSTVVVLLMAVALWMGSQARVRVTRVGAVA